MSVYILVYMPICRWLSGNPDLEDKNAVDDYNADGLNILVLSKCSMRATMSMRVLSVGGAVHMR